MADFDVKRLMIEVKPLASWKKFVHGNRMVKFDVTVRQTPHVFSDSPGRVIMSKSANFNASDPSHLLTLLGILPCKLLLKLFYQSVSVEGCLSGIKF